METIFFKFYKRYFIKIEKKYLLEILSLVAVYKVAVSDEILLNNSPLLFTSKNFMSFLIKLSKISILTSINIFSPNKLKQEPLNKVKAAPIIEITIN